MTRAARMTPPGWMAVLSVGCATTETVMMQHPLTHEIAQCAERYRSFIGGQGYRRQEDCIADYQRKGYERTPVTPGK
jgi:hypothetical protein